MAHKNAKHHANDKASDNNDLYHDIEPERKKKLSLKEYEKILQRKLGNDKINIPNLAML